MNSAQKFQLAVITGASTGIGEALAFLLAEQGINLIICGRNAQQLKEIQEKLSKSVQVQIFVGDLEKSALQDLIKIVQTQAPDLVINNAGWGYYGDALTHDTKTSLGVLQINSKVVLEITLESARAMITQEKQGVILNVASSAAFPICPSFAVYSAAKAFVVQFSQSFDEEVSSFGIRTLVACPGMVATNFRERSGGSAPSNEEKNRSMSSSYAAQEIWKQINNKKSLNVFDWTYKLAIFFVKYVLPKRWVANSFRKSILSRIPSRDIIKTPHD